MECFRLYRLLQTAGQSLASSLAGGKSGLHGDMAVDNVHPAQVEGKCHRKQTALNLFQGKGERVG